MPITTIIYCATKVVFIINAAINFKKKQIQLLNKSNKVVRFTKAFRQVK
jgi:hypothetical protein